MMIDRPDHNRKESSSRKVGNAVGRARRNNVRAIDHVVYIGHIDKILVVCPPFALYVDRTEIRELAGVPIEELSRLTVSPGGMTIELHSYDIYIEAAGLVSDLMDSWRRTERGGLVMELLQRDEEERA
jgi:hypothetical protein